MSIGKSEELDCLDREDGVSQRYRTSMNLKNSKKREREADSTRPLIGTCEQRMKISDG